MANAWIVKPLSATVTAVSSSVQAGLPAYLFNDYAGVVLQVACDAAGNSAGITIDLGADTLLDTLLVFGVELLPIAGTLQLAYATAAQGPFTGAYSNDGSPAAYAGSAAMTSGKGVSFWAAAAPVTARYLRLTYFGTAAGQALRLSRLVIGRRFQPSRNFSFGAGFGAKDLGSLDFSRRGVLQRTRGAKLRTISLTFASIRKDEAEASMRPLIEQLGTTEMFALVTDPVVDAQRQNRCSFGPLVGDVALKWRNAAAWEAGLNQVSIF